MTLYAQRCERDPAYPMTRHSFSPEIEYMYYDAQRKGHFEGVDPAEIRVEAMKTSADENRSAETACQSLVPLLRQEYMRHVSFRHFQGHLMNSDQVSAANAAIALLAGQLTQEKAQVPTFEECMKYTAQKHQVAVEEKELLHAARMPPPKRRAVEEKVESPAWNVSETEALSEAQQAAKRYRAATEAPSIADVHMTEVVNKDQPPCPLPPHMMSSSPAAPTS